MDMLKNTYFPRKCEGVIAVCLICGTKIKGSKKVASNFLQHYRNQHVKEYKEFKHMKSDKKSSKDLNKKKFDEKVLKFIRSSFSPMSAGKSFFGYTAHWLQPNLLLQEEDVLFQRHNSAITECENIWSKTKRPKSYEQIYEILSATLKTPTITRWNSLFDSIQHILQFKDKIKEITNALDLDDFSNEDFNYLEEYTKLMQPIAEALNFFQSEKNIYF
ncbi:hypothetical protein CVS40_9270 [Lucilia cuprina]|nr:hypothetical protein CVS40_9270 [Lucilia cuprina]